MTTPIKKYLLTKLTRPITPITKNIDQQLKELARLKNEEERAKKVDSINQYITNNLDL